MITKLNIKRNTWKILAALLLTSLTFSTSIPSTPVLADDPVPFLSREDMLQIAERYLTYRWTVVGILRRYSNYFSTLPGRFQ